LNWSRINRSALIMAVLLTTMNAAMWAVGEYVDDAGLASLLNHGVLDIGIALGIVSDSRGKGKPVTP
jgi:hypothetical protein